MKKDNFKNVEISEKAQLEMLYLALKKDHLHQEAVIKICSELDFLQIFNRTNTKQKLNQHIQNSNLKPLDEAAKVLRKIYQTAAELKPENKFYIPKNLKKRSIKNEKRTTNSILSQQTETIRKIDKHKGRRFLEEEN